MAAYRADRTHAAKRTRKIIFNNDGTDALYFYSHRPATPENLLAVRTLPTVGTQVDALSYCTLSSGFGLFTHNTRVGEIMRRNMPTQRNITKDLIAQSTDPLKVMVDHCRERRLECFWSMRMNDTSDRRHRPGLPDPLFPRLKDDHPEYLIGSSRNIPEVGAWSAVDYATPQIQKLAVGFVEEVCEHYDIDGVELDFLRHPTFFKSVAFGMSATRRELAIMTGLMRRIRLVTEREGIRRGRPILLAIRVPDSVEYCRRLGIDLEVWLADGLVDILIGAGPFQLNGWDYLADLGHLYGTQVYACLEDSKMEGETGTFRRQSLESYRGQAMQAWLAGVDGIYVSQCYDARAPRLHEIGDPEQLDDLDKLYFVTYRNGRPETFLTGGERFMNKPFLTPDAPVSLECTKTVEFPLIIGDDIASHAAEGDIEATCHLNIPGLQKAEKVEVKINGKELGGGTLTADWVRYDLPLLFVKQGRNVLEARLLPKSANDRGRQARAPDEWDMEYGGDHLLEYPAQLPWRRLFKCSAWVEEIRDGHFFFADRGRGREDWAHLTYPWQVLPEDETVVEVRVKVVSASGPLGVCIRLANGRNVEYLDLQEKRIELRYARLVLPMDTTDEFHTYRILAQDGDIRVLVDGELKLDGRGRFTTSSNDRRTWIPLLYESNDWNRRSFLIGSASGNGTGAALWDYIRFRGETKSVHDLVVSVRYPRKSRIVLPRSIR